MSFGFARIGLVFCTLQQKLKIEQLLVILLMNKYGILNVAQIWNFTDWFLFIQILLFSLHLCDGVQAALAARASDNIGPEVVPFSYAHVFMQPYFYSLVVCLKTSL